MNYHEVLREIISKANTAIRNFDPTDFELKPNPQKWSKKEILGHLVDSAINNHKRFVVAETQGNYVFEGYDQDEWVRKNRYQERKADEILELWIGVNEHLAQVWEGLSEQAFTYGTTDHNYNEICMNYLPEGEKLSLSYLAWDYIFHTEYHLAQIIPNYQVVSKYPFGATSA